jgi:hypothetical protein
VFKLLTGVLEAYRRELKITFKLSTSYDSEIDTSEIEKIISDLFPVVEEREYLLNICSSFLGD